MTEKTKTKSPRFTTPPFVLSYPHIFKAQASDLPGAEPKFSCQAIWTPSKFGDKDKKLWAAITREAARVLKEQFKVKGETRIEVQKAVREKYDSAKFAIRDGKVREDSPGYGPGTLFASLTTTSPPGVIDLAGTRIHPTEGNSDEIYPGCICRATITIKSYDKKGGKGYSFYLGNLQKIKDGTRLDSRVAAEDDFNDEVDGAWIDEEDGAADTAETEDDEIPF